MNEINKKALGGLGRFLVFLAVVLFLPAWTLRYWQAWVFLFVFSGSVLAITLYLMKYDQKLLERRVNAGPGAEKEKSQRTIQSVTSILFLLVIVFPGIDRRLGRSVIAWYWVLAGDALVALGLFVVFLVFKENSFTSGIVEVDPEQKVVSSGPYALVRHPMYAGALVMLAGIPIALGSWWGLLTVLPITAAIVWRLLDEEEFLGRQLAGYLDYCAKVRWRLVPGVW